ncbi:annexin A13-like isoform X1 [Bolinopsis microptera]|uniref:annexin A13-like isoform X1 n=1 Tax=Bolinopsis microptera TaxID=2820187 RepID=UPI0030798DBC
MPGTITPATDFSADKDCQELRNAMKGLGTNETKIINILGNRSREQRLQIALVFKTMYGKDLLMEFKSELSANFLRLCKCLLFSIPQYLAKELKRAMKGSGTDERALVEILVGLDNRGIAEVKHIYKSMFEAELEREIVSETSGDFKRLALSLLQGNRDENDVVDKEVAKEDALELFNAGINRFGTDESNPTFPVGVFRNKLLTRRYEDRFNSILCARSYRHLKMVFAEYKMKYRRELTSDMQKLLEWRKNVTIEPKTSERAGVAGEDIEKSIRSEMSGELELGFLSIIKRIKNTPTYFAEELYKSMKGLGTDDDQLIRIIVWRSEIDLVEIKGAFESLYAKPLRDFIKEDTSGDFKTLLLTILK